MWTVTPLQKAPPMDAGGEGGSLSRCQTNLTHAPAHLHPPLSGPSVATPSSPMLKPARAMGGGGGGQGVGGEGDASGVRRRKQQSKQ